MAGRERDFQAALQFVHTEPARASTSAPPKLALAVARASTVSVAREYFNAAASASDPSMALAKQCLANFPEMHPDIMAELNLVQACHLLDSLGAKVVPLQVRLSNDRMQLVLDAVAASASAYRNPSAVFSLAQQLGLDLHGEQEPALRLALAERALQLRDFEECRRALQPLLDAQVVAAWELAMRLASTPDSLDMPARMALARYAVKHAPLARVDEVLAAYTQLELAWLAGDSAPLADDRPLAVQPPPRDACLATRAVLFDPTHWAAELAPEQAQRVLNNALVLREALRRNSPGPVSAAVADAARALAQDTAASACLQSLAYLLALAEPPSAEQQHMYFALPVTVPCLRALQTLYALQLYLSAPGPAQHYAEVAGMAPYLHAPELLAAAAKQVDAAHGAAWRPAFERMTAYLSDALEAHMLQQLGLDVDTQAFSRDSAYRIMIVEDLAGSGRPDRLAAALQVAARHNVAAWRAHLAFTRAVLSQPRGDAAAAALASQPDLLPSLCAAPADTLPALLVRRPTTRTRRRR